MAHTSMHNIFNDATGLLKDLISSPSFRTQEDVTAGKILKFFERRSIPASRKGNNIWVRNKFYDKAKPTLLLNSHHDTVKPNSGYKRDPFKAEIHDGKLFGLGSNDAGGSLVSLLGAFIHFYERDDLPFNIIYVATAEEEISGKGGIESIINDLGNIQLAIVGEPTQMKMAVAERGLMVLDCVATGKAGHAARNEGVNAIYAALPDIEWFRNYKFDGNSEWLGLVSMNVTMVNAGTAHNQVPTECNFVVDIRLNEMYTHEQVLATIRQNVNCRVKERSTRIKPSFAGNDNPLVLAAKQLNIPLFGSPTTSDMALMPWEAVKIGPGDSARSHSADEFIYINEIEQGIKVYIELMEALENKVK